jgi:hypothetical protein
MGGERERSSVKMKGKRVFTAERKIERGKVRLGAARGGGEK